MRSTSRRTRIGIAAALLILFLPIAVGPRLAMWVWKARVEKIRYDLRAIILAAKNRQAANGTNPATLADMIDETGKAAAASGLLEPDQVRDPWGKPYVYRIIDGRPHAFCYGKEGLPGGDGDDHDYEDSIELEAQTK